MHFSGPMAEPERRVDLNPLLDLLRSRFLQRQLDRLKILEAERRRADAEAAAEERQGRPPRARARLRWKPERRRKLGRSAGGSRHAAAIRRAARETGWRMRRRCSSPTSAGIRVRLGGTRPRPRDRGAGAHSEPARAPEAAPAPPAPAPPAPRQAARRRGGGAGSATAHGAPAAAAGVQDAAERDDRQDPLERAAALALSGRRARRAAARRRDCAAPRARRSARSGAPSGMPAASAMRFSSAQYSSSSETLVACPCSMTERFRIIGAAASRSVAVVAASRRWPSSRFASSSCSQPACLPSRRPTGRATAASPRPALLVVAALALAGLAKVDDLGHGAQRGPIIFSGRTSSSNSSAVTKPQPTASSRSVVPFLCAVLATSAALS